MAFKYCFRELALRRASRPPAGGVPRKARPDESPPILRLGLEHGPRDLLLRDDILLSGAHGRSAAAEEFAGVGVVRLRLELAPDFVVLQRAARARRHRAAAVHAAAARGRRRGHSGAAKPAAAAAAAAAAARAPSRP